MSLERAKTLVEIVKLVVDGWSALSDRSEKRRREQREHEEKDRRIRELKAELARVRVAGGGSLP